MSPNWLFPILGVVLILWIVGPILILRGQRRTRLLPPAASGPAPVHTGPEQVPGESREDFVRRNWQRPGVVATGATLVDLYDRIRVLEDRLARAEQKSD